MLPLAVRTTRGRKWTTAYSRECDSVIPDQSWVGITLRQGGVYAFGSTRRGAVAHGGR